VKIEPEPDFAEALLPHGAQQAGFIRGVEQEKPTAAGPD
jgi:hypothetical protein